MSILYIYTPFVRNLVNPFTLTNTSSTCITSNSRRFRTGPGVVPSKVPQDTKNLVLVLNGREPEKVQAATRWLDYLPQLPGLVNVAVVLLGNEQCHNQWLQPYLRSKGGPVKAVFLVYDSPEVDDENFFQWPLGVATLVPIHCLRIAMT